MPVVKFLARLDLEQNISFLDSLLENNSSFSSFNLNQQVVMHRTKYYLPCRIKRLKRAAGRFVRIAEREFPECKEVLGVDTSNNCGTIAALCQTYGWDRTDYDKDIVATHPILNN